MAWSIVGLGTLTTASSGNLTLDDPANVQQGDLIVACICYRSDAAFTLPVTGDWQFVATQQSSGDTDATQGIASGLMAYCIRGASPPSYAFTRTNGDLGYGRTIAYRGQATSPYDTGVASTLAVIGHPASAAISTAEANELLVAMVASGDNSTMSGFAAATAPTGASGASDTSTAPTAGQWIERQDSGTNTGADGGLFIADAVKAASGTTGAFSATAQAQTRSVTIVGAWKIVPVIDSSRNTGAGSKTIQGNSSPMGFGLFPQTEINVE